MEKLKKALLGTVAFVAIAASVAGGEAREPDTPRQKKFLTEEFGKRMNTADPVRPHLFLDHDKATNTLYILTELYREFGYFPEITKLATFLQRVSQSTETGFAVPLGNMSIATGNMSHVSGNDFASAVGDIEKNIMNVASGLTTEQANRFVLYHEGTHTSQGAYVALPTDIAIYQRSLNELRADIGGIVGMGRDEGNFELGEKIARLRSHGASVGMMEHLMMPMLFGTQGVKMYNNGKELEVAIRVLKTRKDEVFNLSDKDFISFVDEIFNAVKPSFEDYNKKHNILLWTCLYDIDAVLKTEDGGEISAREYVHNNPTLHLELIENKRRTEKCKETFVKNAKPVFGNPFPKP